MPSVLALILCGVLVTVLLHIERRRHSEASFVLWVPTFWVLIYASRPVARWFESNPNSNVESGSPLDRLVLGILMLLALFILHRRKIEWYLVLKDNFWLFLLFIYMGISILWSDFPYVSFKRWLRSVGDILMALVILSELMPLQALESVLRRCAYALVPPSLVLVQYFPHLGRAYGRWSGLPMWTGVTTQKNSLGQLCVLSAFLLIWALLREWRSGDLFKSRYQTYADVLVLAIALFLLKGSGYSYSATSVAVLMAASATLLVLQRMTNLARHIATHLKALAISLVSMYLLFADSVMGMVSSFLGRDETLTGRTTDIWAPLLTLASEQPLLGVGYGGFWGLNSLDLGVLQAHNGYLDVYLELGMVGIALFCTFLLAFCGRVRRELNHSFEWGVFGICFLIMTLLYNNTESSFLQSSSYFWSAMVFLSVVFSEPRLYAEGE